MADVNPTELQLEHIDAKLRQDQEELGQIVDLIPQTIVVLNPLGKAIYANRGTELDWVPLENRSCGS